MGKITKALKSNVTAKEVFHILAVVVVAFLIGWLAVHLYISSINKKLVDEEVSNIIKLLEYRYYANYLDQKVEVVEYKFPENTIDEITLKDIQGRDIVNENGEVALKIYIDNYCATKKYKDSKVTVEKTTLNECLA